MNLSDIDCLGQLTYDFRNSGKCPLKNPARLTLRGVFAFWPMEIPMFWLKVMGLVVIVVIAVVALLEIFTLD